jgi:pimeloyl-ACP methyl ester carboxylesterase
VEQPRGEWLRKPADDWAAVFVHGLVSDGEVCWRNGEVYWPDLLAAEQTLSGMGVYVFSYRTNVFSGGYSIGDAVDALNAYLGLDGLLELRKLIFVCHSMGGIVVRQFLITHQGTLIRNAVRVGLFLIASPSLGSSYANLFGAIARALGHAQTDALRFAADNAWLNDLDRNFMNLKESKRLSIRGQELIEDRFVALPSLLRKTVVPAFSAGRYFGESVKIPGSDHFTIAKPTGSSSLQHRLLVRFIGGMREGDEMQLSAAAAPQGASKERFGIESPALGRIRLRLVAPVPDSTWREFDSRHVTLGRGANNSFVVDDPIVSWEHGIIAVERGAFVYRHLSRTNPTEVRGRGREVRLEEGGLQETALVNQDRISIGSATLIVEFSHDSDAGYVTTTQAPKAQSRERESSQERVAGPEPKGL